MAATGQTRRQNPNADVLWHLSLWVTARKPPVSRYQRRAELLGELQLRRIHQTMGVTSRPSALQRDPADDPRERLHDRLTQPT